MRKHRYRGSALVMILVVMAVFIIMVMAGMRLIALEANQVTNQKFHDQTFHVAEGGIHYALLLMGSGNVAPNELQPITNYQVTDPVTSQTIGSFNLTFSTTVNNGVTTVVVTSVGHHQVRTNFSETIVVTLQTSDNSTYKLVSWHHL